MASLIGNKPNQISTNGDLGKLAFMDVLDSFTSKTIMDTDTTNIAPSLNLDFANSKTLDPRITFTRSTTGTFYDGKSSAKAEENLLTFSEQFDNAAWVKVDSSVTANGTTAPDGTTTADTILETANNNYHGAYQLPALTASQTYTLSVYLKKNTRKYAALGLGFSAGAGLALQIDLDLGTIAYSFANGTGYGIVSSSITSVGNGWYRVSAVVTNGTSAGVFLVASGGSTLWTSGNINGNTFVGTTSDGIYVWGAQLEQRSAVSAYTPTTTQAITNYIPTLQTASAGVARFDHNPLTGESLGFLVEEQRTNLLQYSEQFDQAWWSKQNAGVASAPVVTANAGIAPDGTQSADLVVFTLNGGTASGDISSLTSGSISITAQQYTGSFWAKTTDGTSAVVTVLNPDGTPFSKTITSSWTRITFTSTGVVASSNFRIRLRGGEGTANYASILLWGAQLEAGSFPTSYIPTVASQVTRSADAASMTGTNFSSWYNISQGTLFTQTTLASLGSTGADIVSITNSSGAGIELYRNSGGSTLTVYVGSGTVATTATINPAFKYALGYSPNSASFATTNSTVLSITPATYSSVSGATVLNIMKNNAFGVGLSGWVQKIQYYPAKLSNAELMEITG